MILFARFNGFKQPRVMDIKEIIEFIGSENIGVQNLEHCMKGASARKDHDEVTFGAPKGRVMGGGLSAFIIWFPKEKMNELAAETKRRSE